MSRVLAVTTHYGCHNRPPLREALREALRVPAGWTAASRRGTP